MESLFKYYKNALTNGLCNEYKGYWRSANGDKERLFCLAMRQQSIPHLFHYSYSGTGMTREDLIEGFSDFVNGKYTVIDADGVVDNYKTQLYVGFTGELSPSNDVTAFMWCDIPSLQFKATRCEKIYVGCNSKVNVSCDGFNNIIVMLFDESEIVLEDIDENSSVFVYKYSDKCKVTKGKFCFGKVKEFEKQLKL